MSHHGCFLSKTPFTPLQKEDPPPARAWPLPQLFTISLIVLRPSTPFCKGKTKVSGPHQGSHCFRHPSASAALQPSMMTSATNFSSLSKAWESKIGPSCEAGTWGELQTDSPSYVGWPLFLFWGVRTGRVFFWICPSGSNSSMVIISFSYHCQIIV